MSTNEILSEYKFVQCFGLSQLAWHNRPKLFLCHFQIIFQTPKVNMQVQNDHGVLIRLVLCLKCMELACLVLQCIYLRKVKMMIKTLLHEIFGFRKIEIQKWLQKTLHPLCLSWERGIKACLDSIQLGQILTSLCFPPTAPLPFHPQWNMLGMKSSGNHCILRYRMSTDQRHHTVFPFKNSIRGNYFFWHLQVGKLLEVSKLYVLILTIF